MRLFEEYLNRHNIKIPVVYHNPYTSLLYKRFDQGKFTWEGMAIKWIEEDRHPGYFYIQTYIPTHDGFYKESLFQVKTHEREWTAYETFIYDWVKTNPNVVPISGRKEIVLSAWEMFVYIADSWFQRQSFACKELLFNSLDEYLTVDERYVNYQLMTKWISNCMEPGSNQIEKSWRYEVLPLFHGYGDWLVALCNARESNESTVFRAG